MKIKTKRLTYLGKYLLNEYFLTVFSKAVFITQPTVYGGAFLQKC